MYCKHGPLPGLPAYDEDIKQQALSLNYSF